MYDNEAKETRNSVLAVLTFLVESPRFCAALHNSPLLQLLANAACVPDLQAAKEAGITAFAVQCDQLGHEQYRLLWNILASLCDHSSACRSVVLEAGFLRLLLLYTDLAAERSTVRRRFSPAGTAS